MTKEIFVIPEGNLWEYIGDLSQDILECSYNEDDIRERWVKGGIDQDAREMLEIYHWRLEGWRREDKQYSDMLTAFVILHGGWATHWGPEIDTLTPEEETITAAFRAKYDILVKTHT